LTSFSKYFIAIIIPEPFFSEIEEMKAELFGTEGLKGALRSPAHITLHRPFEWREEKEVLLINGLRKFRFERQVEIALHGFDFFAPRVLFVSVEKNETLDELHQELKMFCARTLNLFNERDDMRAFHPHVTIASRDLRRKFEQLRVRFAKMKYEAKFKAEKIALLKLREKWQVIEEIRLKNQ
jgi:2'-5' RNA ligase